MPQSPNLPLPRRWTVRRALLPVLAGASLLCAAKPALTPPQPVLVLAHAELAPWMTHEGARFSGAYIEIVRELARRLGRRLEIVDCPLKRCLLMLQSGEADLTIGMKQTPEREAFMQFLAAPYRRSVGDRVFWVRRGESARIKRYDDLHDLRIGVALGSTYFARFDEDSSLIKDAVLDNEVNLRKLMLHRVDAVLIPEDQAVVLIHQLHLDGQVVPAQYRVQDLTPRSIAVSRATNAASLVPLMEVAMQAMRGDGTLAAIYEKHYYQRYGVTHQQFRLDN